MKYKKKKKNSTTLSLNQPGYYFNIKHLTIVKMNCSHLILQSVSKNTLRVKHLIGKILWWSFSPRGCLFINQVCPLFNDHWLIVVAFLSLFTDLHSMCNLFYKSKVPFPWNTTNTFRARSTFYLIKFSTEVCTNISYSGRWEYGSGCNVVVLSGYHV